MNIFSIRIAKVFLWLNVITYQFKCLCKEVSQLEQLLIDQGITYIKQEESLQIDSNYNGPINLQMNSATIKENLYICLKKPVQLNIYLKNVEIENLKDQKAFITICEDTQLMKINQIELHNCISQIAFLFLDIPKCGGTCQIGQIIFVNTIFNNPFIWLKGFQNLQIAHLNADSQSIHLSVLPLIKIDSINASQTMVQMGDFFIPSEKNFTNQSDEDIKANNNLIEYKSRYDNQQGSLIQIIGEKSRDTGRFLQFVNMNIDFENKLIRFLERINIGSNIEIEKSSFKNMRSLENGGCIYLQGFGQITIRDSTFDSCSSENFGGAVMGFFVQLYTNTFKNCFSKIGGAVFAGFKDEYTSFDKNSTFIGNQATVLSPNIHYCPMVGQMTPACGLFSFYQIFEYNPTLPGTPLYIVETNYTIKHSEIHTVGFNQFQSTIFSGILYVLRLQITQSENNITNFDSYQIIGNLYNYLSPKHQQYYYPISIQNISYPYLVTMYSQYFFDCSSQNTDFMFSLDYFGLKTQDSGNLGLNYFSGCFNQTNQCKSGMFETIALGQQICQYCRVNEYSYIVTENCNICSSDQFQICYANQTSLKNGFWRQQLTAQINQIYSCDLNPNSCQSEQRDGVGNSLCSDGYIGEQCLRCDINGEYWGEIYGESNQFQCQKCNSLENNQLYFILAICFQLFILLLSLYSNSKRMKNQIRRKYLRKLQLIYIGTSFIRQSLTAVYIKILLFNFQIYLTAYYFVNFNKQNHTFDQQIFSFFNPFQNQGRTSYDCFLKTYFPNYKSIGFIKLYISFFSPIIINAALLLVMLLFKLIKKQNLKNIQYIMLNCYSYTILFLFQQSILSYSIQSLKCIQLSQDSYLFLDTQYNCLDESNIKGVQIIGLISIMIYVVLTPIVLFIIIFLQRKQLNRSKIIRLLGFLYDEYKKEFYYWQFLKISLSIMQVVLLQLMKTQPILAVLIYCGLLAIYAVSIQISLPFNYLPLNKIELGSVLLSILYLLASVNVQLTQTSQLMYENTSIQKGASNFYYYTVLVLMGIFYIYMVLLTISSLFNTSIQKLQRFRIFNQLFQKFPNIFSKIYSRQLKKNFKIMRTRVRELIKQNNLEDKSSQDFEMIEKVNTLS